MADLVPLFCLEFVWIETSIPEELVKNLSDLLRQDEMLTADSEEGGKAGKAEVWHSQVLSLYLKTVNSEESEIVNCVCDRRVKVTLRHHFLEVELTLLFYIFVQVIYEYTDQQPVFLLP